MAHGYRRKKMKALEAVKQALGGHKPITLHTLAHMDRLELSTLASKLKLKPSNMALNDNTALRMELAAHLGLVKSAHIGEAKPVPRESKPVSAAQYGKCPQCGEWGTGSCAKPNCYFAEDPKAVQQKLRQMEKRAPSTSTLANGYTMPDVSGTSSLSTGHDDDDDYAYEKGSDGVWRKITKPKAQTYSGKGAGSQTGFWDKGTWSGKSYVRCYSHKAEKLITRIRDADIYIGALRDVDTTDCVLLIQCAANTSWFGVDNPASETTLPPEYESLRAHMHRPSVPLIVIPWADMSTPPVLPTFWQALVDTLPKGKVILACQGGHGRSGTALAALLMVAHGFTADRAIAYVRKEHCEEAIETKSQEMYLGALEKHLAN